MTQEDRQGSRERVSAQKRALIRQQVGTRYGMLPIDESWMCLLHRRSLPLPSYNADNAPEDRAPPPECEVRLASLWPADARRTALDHLGLYRGWLPDDREFVLVPFERSFRPALLAREWRAIVAGARMAKDHLLAHAYDVSLERLQIWLNVGGRTAQWDRHLTERHASGAVDQSANPFRDFVPDYRTRAWISTHASDLLDGRAFTPHIRARELLADLTGWTADTVESAIYRHRKKRV